MLGWDCNHVRCYFEHVVMATQPRAVFVLLNSKDYPFRKDLLHLYESHWVTIQMESIRIELWKGK